MSIYSLYLVTDRGLSLGRSSVEIVEAAVRGGVTCVQLREKSCSTRTFIAEAEMLKDLLDASGIPLIINDRVDVALVVDAAGVHLGQSDMELTDARKLLGDSKLIGISAESVADAIQAEKDGADYIGLSPVFATPTKTDTAAPLGLEGVAAIRKAVKLPMVGIGGINLENCGAVIKSGADGIAVVSAIVSAPDPEIAAHQLREALSSASQGGREDG